MDNTERVKGYITYRTFVISDEADGAAEFEEQCYEGECLVEKDEAGIPLCAVFEETPGTDDAGASGPATVTVNTLRLSGNGRVSLVRKGIMSSELCFAPDETLSAKIDTPYGGMELSLVTHGMEVIKEQSGARISAVYSFLEAPGERHNLSISISL